MDIVKNTGEQNSAEAWRRLLQRFDGRSMEKEVHKIRKVVNPGTKKWEVTQIQLQKQYAINLDGDSRSGILLEMMPPQDLC